MERWIGKHRDDAVKLLRRRERWRELPPTEKQIEALRKLKLPVPKGLKRGDAAMMIAFDRASRG